MMELLNDPLNVVSGCFIAYIVGFPFGLCHRLRKGAFTTRAWLTIAALPAAAVIILGICGLVALGQITFGLLLGITAGMWVVSFMDAGQEASDGKVIPFSRPRN